MTARVCAVLAGVIKLKYIIFAGVVVTLAAPDFCVGRDDMQDVLKDYWGLRDTAKKLGNEIAGLYKVEPLYLPANVFSMAFNDITLALELLDHYYKIWGDPTAKISTTIEEAKKQNAERIIAIQKMVFIGIMSSIEYCGKQIVTQLVSKFGDFKGRIYGSIRNSQHDFNQ